MDKTEKPVIKSSKLNEHTFLADKLDDRLMYQLKRFSKIAGLISIIIGFIVLIGWALNIDVLKSILPNIISMKSNTALCFILIGVALFLLNQKRISTRTLYIVRICAVIISIIGLLTIIEYLFNINLGIDQLLFKEAVGTVLTINPGRMAVTTAINFLLIGMGVLIIALNSKYRYGIYQLFILIAGIISLFSFLGYIYGATISYSAVPTPMALNTSITFIIVSLGFLFLYPDQGIMTTLTSTSMGGVMARRLLPPIIILLTIIGLFRIVGEDLGFYNYTTGVAITIIIGIIILSFLIWDSAASLNRIDLERKKAEEELKESEKVYREFFDNPLNGFALCETITDEKGEPTDFVYLEVNKAFENFTGLKREEVLNKRVTDVLPYEEVADIIQIYGKVALTGESTVFQYPIPSLGKYYEINAFSPRKKQFIAFFNDITERKKAEEALQEAYDTLEDKVEERTAEIEEAYQLVKENEFKLKEVIAELERSNKELESFAYITSHDLQEPLRSIASYSQLIERRYKGQLDDDADDFIDFMVIGAKRMKSMIQGLLEYSRVGTRGEEFREFNVEEALSYALLNLKSAIDECHAEVTYDSLPVVLGDETQITSVFQNLIGNAIKYKKPQFPPRIHISARKEGNEYIFSVQDNGIGMEKQYSGKIFEVFKRLHPIGEYDGTGIGLSIVKRIIERHHGRVWVESSLGEGSTFYFTIPINK